MIRPLRTLSPTMPLIFFKIIIALQISSKMNREFGQTSDLARSDMSPEVTLEWILSSIPVLPGPRQERKVQKKSQ